MKTQVIDFNQSRLSPKGLALSLGGFDGIHLGHQALLNRLFLTAKERKAPSGLCLFHPLPFQVLKGQKDFKRLLTIEETQELLKVFPLDFFCIIPFNQEFSKLNPKEFIHSFIVQHFDPVHILVGYDFSFAYQRRGDFSVLKNLAHPLGFSTEQTEAYLYEDKPVSSSRIRKCLSSARMEEVAALLGRPFSIQSRVIKGEARGRRLGFPTANLRLCQKELPPFGVYGGRAKAGNLWYKAVVNIGRRPTFVSSSRSILTEVHIISENLNLYDQDLKVELDVFIRKERIFPRVSELKSAIKQDIQKVLEFYTDPV